MGRKDKMKKGRKSTEKKAQMIARAEEFLPQFEAAKLKLEKDMKKMMCISLVIKYNRNRKAGELEDVMTDTDIKIEFMMDHIAVLEEKILECKAILQEHCGADKTNTNTSNNKKDPPTGGMGGNTSMVF